MYASSLNSCSRWCKKNWVLEESINSDSSIGIKTLAKVTSLFLAFSSLCLKGSSSANKFLESLCNNFAKNSFLVSFSNFIIVSFLGSLTSMYNYFKSISLSSSEVYSRRFLTFAGFLNKFSDLIGGIWGPLFFHSALTYTDPEISFCCNFVSFLSFSSWSLFNFYFYSSV